MAASFILKKIFFFIIIVLFQSLILNNIELSGFLNPYPYLIFILLLPFETPNWLLLFIAFLLGFSIDFFSDTFGLHASATVFIAYLRPYVLFFLSPRDSYEAGTFPRIDHYGFIWTLQYSFIMVFFHHIFYFYIEVLTFTNFLETFLRIILSVIFSTFIILLTQFFLYMEVKN